MLRTMQATGLETVFDLGALFARVEASIVFGTHVGATVYLDSEVIYTTSLTEIPSGADEIHKRRMLRAVAMLAIVQAHKEIGLDMEEWEKLQVKATLARALPLVAETFRKGVDGLETF